MNNPISEVNTNLDTKTTDKELPAKEKPAKTTKIAKVVKEKPVKVVKEKPVKLVKEKPVKLVKIAKVVKEKPIKVVKEKPVKPIYNNHVIKLIVDERERGVHKFASDYWNSILWEKKTITIGDYAIILNNNEPRILFTIERKSLQDFAASFKDGRYNNKEKLRFLQQKTGCRVMFIIEGPRITNPSRYIGGIMYSHIESAIIHMEMQYKWCFHYTTNEIETAEFLNRLIYSLHSMYCNKKLPLDELKVINKIFTGSDQNTIELTDYDNITENKETNANNVQNVDDNQNVDENVDENQIVDDINGDQNVDQNVDQIVDDNQNVDVNELLKFNFVKSDESVVREMWSALSGIAVTTANIFMKYSLADLICGRVSKKELMDIKYANGRSVPTRTINRLAKLSEDDHVKILAKIPSLSRNTANMVLAEFSMSVLLHNEFDLDTVRHSGGKKLNKKVQENIKKYFNYKLS